MSLDAGGRVDSDSSALAPFFKRSITAAHPLQVQKLYRAASAIRLALYQPKTASRAVRGLKRILGHSA